MNVKETFKEIIQSEDQPALITFLKNLEKEDKKVIKEEMKRLAKKQLEYLPFDQGKMGMFAKPTNKQEWLMLIALFVCGDFKTMTTYYKSSKVFSDDFVEQVYSWFVPSWLGKLFDFQIKNWYIPSFSYEKLLHFIEKDFFQPSEEVIANQLSQAIRWIKPEIGKNERSYSPEKLELNPITIQEHIWLLFQYPSAIDYIDRGSAYYPAEGRMISDLWKETFKSFSAMGKLDRMRVLKESLLACCRNFNKPFTGWFADLFVYMEPTEEELLQLQPELSAVLNAPHSKPANMVLKFYKKLATHQAFDTALFMQDAAVLLNSEVKAMVNSTLMILEKVAKKQAGLAPEICILTTQAFLQGDEKIQGRAAKLITKFGTSEDELLQETLQMYQDNLLHNTRTLLEGFISETDEQEEAIDFSEAEIPAEESYPLPEIHSFDDLLFLCAQALDNNETFHFEQAVAALVNWKISEEDLMKLEPVFQRAYRLIREGGRSHTGFLDRMLAAFFIEIGQWLSFEYPKTARPLRLMHKEETKKLQEAWGSKYDYTFTPFSGSEDDFNINIYKPFYQLLQEAIKRIKTKVNLPLLSTPTHQDGSIAPETLIDRLAEHYETGFKPHSVDLQVALSRVNLSASEKALEELNKLPAGETQAILRFLLTPGSLPLKDHKMTAAWLVAAIRRDQSIDFEAFDTVQSWENYVKNLALTFKWEAQVEEKMYMGSEWDPEAGRYNRVPVTYFQKQLLLTPKRQERKDTLSEKLYKLNPMKRQADYFLYQYFPFKPTLQTNANDLKRIISLIPAFPEPLLATILQATLKDPATYYTLEKDTNLKLLEAALELDLNLSGEMGHLFLAVSMLCSDKTTRAMAAELWIKLVQEDKLKPELLGNMLGEMEQIEMVPLKRLTDLMSEQMFRISATHNQALLVMLEHCLDKLPEKPIKNLKKLLEIYVEVLAITPADKERNLPGKLENWKASVSLKKVIKTLEELIPMSEGVKA